MNGCFPHPTYGYDKIRACAPHSRCPRIPLKHPSPLRGSRSGRLVCRHACRGILSVEVSLPSLVYGHNAMGLTDPEEIERALCMAAAELAELMERPADLWDWNLSMLCVTYDRQLSSPEEVATVMKRLQTCVLGNRLPFGGKASAWWKFGKGRTDYRAYSEYLQGKRLDHSGRTEAEEQAAQRLLRVEARANGQGEIRRCFPGIEPPASIQVRHLIEAGAEEMRRRISEPIVRVVNDCIGGG